ncbi:hypothetical protein CBS9595_001072 [Malassezia furfur]|nr:hypothetical protein CBS9595_001072 [Malassezia furfur]
MYVVSLTFEEMHGKFLNPGQTRKFHFEVTRLRDGRSYATRRVDAIQDGILVFTASMSFQRPEQDQPEYFAPPPVVNAASKFELLREVPDGHSNVATHVLPPDMCLSGENLFDYAMENMSKDSRWYAFLEATKRHQEWLPVEYRQFLLGAMQANINKGPPSMMASLDHTMWFSNAFHMSDWLLMVIENQSTSNGRALILARIYNSNGVLVATTNTYLLPNIPVIIPFDLVQDWPAYTDLVDGGKVHWTALASRYGDHEVPVITKSDEGCHPKTQKLAEAIKQIERASNVPIYIKDWHLVRTARTDALSRTSDDPSSRTLPYRTPFLFADDWMNNVTLPAKSDAAPFLPDAWLLSERGVPLESDDFRFCYAGTKGSSTPLHRDGFPDRRTSELAPSFAVMEAWRADGKLGPYSDGLEGWTGWEEVRSRVYTVEQELNHNWCNSVNLISMYEAMEHETDDVTEALSDVREMLQQNNPSDWQTEFAGLVQDIVRQDAGWAWEGFWHMILHNITQSIYRPSEDFVYARIRTLISRFSHREEAAWLPASVTTELRQLSAAVGRNN